MYEKIANIMSAYQHLFSVTCKGTRCFVKSAVNCCLEIEISHSSFWHVAYADKMINAASKESNSKLKQTNNSG